MRTRDIQIITRLNSDEHAYFKKRVKKSGLSQEAYMRQLIHDLVPTDAPPPDYFAMMTELRRIGGNLNQIAQKAHTLNALDVKQYDENIAMVKAAIVNITNAVMLPRKVEKREPAVGSITQPTSKATMEKGR